MRRQKEVWKQKFWLIFILLKLSKMHGARNVNLLQNCSYSVLTKQIGNKKFLGMKSLLMKIQSIFLIWQARWNLMNTENSSSWWQCQTNFHKLSILYNSQVYPYRLFQFSFQFGRMIYLFINVKRVHTGWGGWISSKKPFNGKLLIRS